MLRTTSCSFPSFKSPSRQWKQQRVELKTDWKCSECSMNLKKTSLNLELFLCLSSDRQKPGGLPEGPQLTNNKQTQRTEEETFSDLQQASSHAPSLCCTPPVMEVRYLTNQRYLRDHNGSPWECPDSNVTHSDSLRSCGTFCLPIRVQQNVSIKHPEPRSAPCCSDKTQMSCCTEVNRFITCI